MKKLFTILLMLVFASGLHAQKLEKAELKTFQADTLTNEYLDTLNVRKALVVNDYSLIGVQYGVGLSRVMWNPPQEQSMLFVPVNFGVTYTRYGQMFAMPYFAFKAGLFYAKEGYQFEYNEEYDWTYKVEGAEKAILEVVELPLLFQFHYDSWNFKIIAEVGCYGGYRLGIQRFPGKTGNVRPELEYSFTETDRRLDYGLKGGVGLALVFDPLEFHITASYKHSLSSLYTPDHYSQYYYRFAYPSNIIVSAGVHYQLSKRTGKTKASLKKEAKAKVYENSGSKSR
ncbi:MAG: outer membrane beta-barrel protein [Bacteroidales bacterium]|jgi:hypothetical protein|nr:outer membrane beta-barrel protein [Bacteroidales bacterium]